MDDKKDKTVRSTQTVDVTDAATNTDIKSSAAKNPGVAKDKESASDKIAAKRKMPTKEKAVSKGKSAAKDVLADSDGGKKNDKSQDDDSDFDAETEVEELSEKIDPFLGLDKESISELFDAEFYLKQNRDVRITGVDPLSHYMDCGWSEGRRGLLAVHPDVFRKSFGLSGYVDVLAFLSLEARGKLPVDIEHNLPILRPKVSAIFKRNLLDGIRQLRPNGDKVEAFDYDEAKVVYKMFDAAYFRGEGAHLVSHMYTFFRYVDEGLFDGKNPGPIFDEVHYRSEMRARNCEIHEAESPFLHWLQYGLPRWISPTPLFEVSEYLRLNQDLLSYNDWPFLHFLFHGLDEGRRFGREFSATTSMVGNVTSMSAIGSLYESPSQFSGWLKRTRSFQDSTKFTDLIDGACELEPEIGHKKIEYSNMPPVHDTIYLYVSAMINRIERTSPEPIKNFIFVPFGKMGGADYVAGIVHKTMNERAGRSVLIRTDQSSWDRPDWYGDKSDIVDLSDIMSHLSPDDRTHALLTIIRRFQPEAIINVNSYTCFNFFSRFSKQLADKVKLFSYYFCADVTPEGVRVGYPISYYLNTFHDMTGVFVDSEALRDEFISRVGGSTDVIRKIHLMKTPFQYKELEEETPPAPEDIDENLVLWAGRLDRQKRFDVVIDIARRMPETKFMCWGKTVLGDAEMPTDLPANISLGSAFQDYDELPLHTSLAWLYTSEWDGIPTILIELGIRGVPIVASAVGGVPEVVTPDTGWPVDDVEDIDAYVAALQDIRSKRDLGRAKATKLKAHVKKIHGVNKFENDLMKAVGA